MAVYHRLYLYWAPEVKIRRSDISWVQQAVQPAMVITKWCETLRRRKCQERNRVASPLVVAPSCWATIGQMTIPSSPAMALEMLRFPLSQRLSARNHTYFQRFFNHFDKDRFLQFCTASLAARFMWSRAHTDFTSSIAVSYTHLTLPTICSV